MSKIAYKEYNDLMAQIKELEEKRKALGASILAQMQEDGITEDEIDDVKVSIMTRTTYKLSEDYDIGDIELVAPDAIKREVDTKVLQANQEYHKYLSPSTSEFIQTKIIK